MGVIGQNGAGKSTLIKLLTGQELPDKGQIKWQKGVKIGYLDQYAESAHDLTIQTFLRSAFADLDEIAAELTDEQWDQFESTVAGTVEFAEAIRALRIRAQASAR